MSTNPLTSKNYAATDCLLLLLFGAVIYLPFLGVSAWDGNEPIRVIIAKEMLRSGNWTIPILHGHPYFAKPPLLNWLIAASGSLFGSVNEWTSRIPSVLTMFLTVLSVYFLTVKWLGRDGRFFASLMTLCMIGLMSKGREAEIESLQIFFISFILLVWINGYVRQWKSSVLWGLALSLVGIGFLSKGPQVIFFFYMTVVPYLLIRKRMALFFSKGHALGVGLMLLVLSLYMLSVLQWTTLDQYMQTWIKEGIQRTESRHSLTFLVHLLEYPLNLAMYFMPCILFLIPLVVYKELRKEAKKLFSNELFMFSFIVVAANFPLYWLLPNMHARYFLPAGPFVALVAAVIFELYLRKLPALSAIDTFFIKFLKVFTLLTIFLAASVIPVVIFLHLKFSFPLLFFITCALFSDIVILYKSKSVQLTHIPIYITLITALFFLIYTDLDIQMDSKSEINAARIAGEINLLLPPDVDMVYEIGYRRFLPLTCYIDREVYQLDTFAELKTLEKKKGKIYFIFDTAFLDNANAESKNIFLHDLHWVKVYSNKFKDKRGEIIVGTSS